MPPAGSAAVGRGLPHVVHSLRQEECQDLLGHLQGFVTKLQRDSWDGAVSKACGVCGEDGMTSAPAAGEAREAGMAAPQRAAVKCTS